MTTNELLKSLGWSDELLKAHAPTIPDVADQDEFDCIVEPETVATTELTFHIDSLVLTSGDHIFI